MTYKKEYVTHFKERFVQKDTFNKIKENKRSGRRHESADSERQWKVGIS